MTYLGDVAGVTIKFASAKTVDGVFYVELPVPKLSFIGVSTVYLPVSSSDKLGSL